ncbi:MAG: TonB-dependent receptor [Acidobacteria bacterium]|nr:TonB-dependent receptor [Acidobacteriota bacterium]
MSRATSHLLLFSCAFALPLFGQSEVGGATLNGAITDPTGAAVAGAKITVSNPETGYSRASESNESGLYTLVRLPVGRYDMLVEKQGFKPTRRTGLGLAIGAVATLNIALELGATQETVTITEELPLVESTRSQTSTVVNERAVKELPVNGRNFMDFVVLTPGVVRDPTRTGDLSFAGQRGTANSLLIDGGDSNNLFFGQSSGRAGGGRNPYTFSTEAVQEFQVNAAGYNAEMGRSGGGIINVITRSGTNEYHAAGLWFFRDRALNANTFLNNAGNRPRQPYHFNQYGGNAGGPIKKDKVFFFYNYDGQRNTGPNEVFFPFSPPVDALSQQAVQEISKYLASYTTTQNNDIHTVKIDYILSPSENISGRYNGHRFKGANFENGGPRSAQSGTGNSNVFTDNVAINYTKTIGARAVWDSRFIYMKDDLPGTANSNDPETTVRQNGVTYLRFGRNSFSPRYTITRRYQPINSVTHLRGRHTYKMGFDLNFERIENFFPGNFGGVWTFDSLADYASRRPFSFTQGFAGPGTEGPLTFPNANEYAFFVQDNWRVSDRLTLNYGVRYDLFSYAQAKVKNPDQRLLAAGLDTSRVNRDKNNWAPRFGFAYKANQSGRIVARGGYGVFYGRTASILIGTAHSQNGIQVQTYTLQSNFPAYPNILTGIPSAARTIDIYVVAPNYVQPVTHQWNANLEFQLGKDWALTLGYLGVRGVHLSRTRDINLFPADAQQGRYADGTAVTYLRRPGNRPNPAFRRISLFDSGGDSIYHGGFVQLTKRFSKNFQLLTSYTWSKVIDTTPDQTSVVVGGGDDAKVAQDTLLPNLDRARGEADIRHVWVLSGVWDVSYARSLSNPALRALLRDYQLSLITSVRSPRPFSPTVGGNSDVNNDGNNRTDRSPGFGRNSVDAYGFAGVDVRFSRDIGLYKERAKLRLIFEVFNLTNRANFLDLNRSPFNFNLAARTFTPVATYRTPSVSGDPRIMQLAARIFF